MKIRRVLLQEIRKFVEPVELSGLQPGLNLFSGPNEAGKSTIALALRTAFLVNHKTTTVGHLAPWGVAQPQPRIEVEFEIGEDHYLLRKSFLSRKRCELIRNTGESLDGEAAEEQLAALLRFSRAARGAGAPDHAGVPGLLWITQGEAQAIAAPVRHASSHLRDALGQLSGSRLEGGEDALIREIRSKLHELVTERTRAPTGAYQKAIDILKQTSQAREELIRQQNAFENDVKRLEQVREEVMQRESRRLWEENERKSVEAQRRLDQLEAAKRELGTRTAQLQATRDRIKLLEDLERQAAAQRDNLATLRAQHRQAQSDAAQAATALSETADEMDAARAALAVAQDAHQRAARRERAAQLRQSIGIQQANLDRLNAALANAGIARAKIKAVQTRIADTEIDDAQIARLAKLENTLATLVIRLESTATRLRYRLEAGKEIHIDGHVVTGSGEVLVGTQTSLAIPDVGTVSVTPGASDSGTLCREMENARVERDGLLRELNVASLAEAQQRRDANRQSRIELAAHRNELALHAPDGIDALETAAGVAVRQLEHSRQDLAAMDDATEALPLAFAQSALAECAERVDFLQKRYETLVGRRAETSATERALLDQIRALDSTIDGLDGFAERSNHQAQLESSRTDERMHTLAIEEISKQVETLSLQVSPDDPQRFATSANLQSAEYERLKNDLNTLALLLEQQGATGLGERLAEAEAAIQQQTRRRDELKQRADALMMLVDMLVAERDKTVLSLQAPLVSRMDHYFRRLFPGASMTLDENLMFTALHRNGQRATLDELSFGTQEQLGILARLAYADLLKDCGVPVFLVLDDTCVHTDAARRDRIKRALLDAATRHQIFMLTCHPHDWSDLGLLPRAIGERPAAAHG